MTFFIGFYTDTIRLQVKFLAWAHTTSVVLFLPAPHQVWAERSRVCVCVCVFSFEITLISNHSKYSLSLIK